jgi:L-threonylcarbamoyladenylate synthase
VDEQLGDKIKYILDGGKCEVGIESTIVGMDNGELVVYRMGGLSIEDIESVIGKVKIQTHSSSNPRSPGQLDSHYAPGKKVFVGKIEELLLEYPAHHVGLLTFQNDFNSPNQYILSPSGSLEEAAQNLFEGLRAFDKMDVDVVFAELVPDVGIGRAINDRLKRAAAAPDRR